MWLNLGTIGPEFNRALNRPWQRFAEALGDGPIYRVRQTWRDAPDLGELTYNSANYDQARDHLLLAVATAAGDRNEPISLYPWESSRLLVLPPNPELQARGLGERWLDVRAAPLNQWHQVNEWRLTLERWGGPVTEPELLPPSLSLLRLVY